MAAPKISVDSVLDEHLKRIGKIAALWAQFDSYLDFTLWRIAAVEQRVGACFTSQIGSFHGKFRILFSLLDMMTAPDSLIRRAKRLYNSCHEIAELRARAVHDQLTVGVETKTVYQTQYRVIKDKLVFGNTELSVDELDNTIEKMKKQNIKIYDLFSEIEIQLSSLPDGWRKGPYELQLYRSAPVEPESD